MLLTLLFIFISFIQVFLQVFNYTAATGITLQHQHKGTPNTFFFLLRSTLTLNKIPFQFTELNCIKANGGIKKVTKSSRFQDSDERYQRAGSRHNCFHKAQEQRRERSAWYTSVC